MISPSSLNSSNIDKFRSEFKQFHKFIQHKHTLAFNSYNHKQIKKFVQQRCDNYNGNQSQMLDSFLARDKRSIFLDRVLKTSDDGSQTLITDPKEIKKLVNTHFQTCPGGKHENKFIPPAWQQQYNPLDTIDNNIYNGLMSDPTLEEWNTVVNNLPKGKAAGPSQISNEMLQHLGPKMQDILWQFICACIKLNDIPNAWRQAHIYPIPKPKPWECELTNTHPIMLLETPRKALVRLLNNRLANIMVQNKVLKGNQFAGLPGSSTFEPIRIFNEIVEDAREKNSELWVLFQDLSKAYDKVNIEMLRKAFHRLKIPTTFTDLIIQLFTNRTNQVFTAIGTTESYEVVIGIDQGEVISKFCVFIMTPYCARLHQET